MQNGNSDAVDVAERVHIFQIFYNEETRSALDPAYIPLDNSANERPDWFEFWPIRNYLHSNNLQKDHWYGFLSPNFTRKTLITSTEIHSMLANTRRETDVILLSQGWAQLSYFRNVFEQGEFWHPKLMEASQAFLRHIGIRMDLRTMVTHTANSAFSNYVIAKPSYWKLWLILANQLFEYVEAGGSRLAAGHTNYGVGAAPMKTFIQERISAIVLSTDRYHVATIDNPRDTVVDGLIFDSSRENIRTLKVLDFLKRKYVATRDEDYIKVFEKVRNDVKMKPEAIPMLPWNRRR